MYFYNLNHYKNTEADSKQLNFPIKIKNFTNSLEPSLFLKENKNFFLSKIFTITHKYFYNYMKEHNILSEPIILLKKTINISPTNSQNNEKEKQNKKDVKEEKNKKEKDERRVFDCELIKIEKTYFGQLSIINSTEEEFLLFEQKKFHLSDNEENLKEELEKNIFSLSSLEFITTENTKEAKQNAKNSLLDEDIFYGDDLYKNKRIIIFLSDIEEIVERRILFLWQGIEIFLKNGKSYIFNMLTIDHYNALKEKLQKFPKIL